MIKNSSIAFAILTSIITIPFAIYCGFHALIDNDLLIKANQQITKQENIQNTTDYLMSREINHRINVFALGVWFLQSVNIVLLAWILMINAINIKQNK